MKKRTKSTLTSFMVAVISMVQVATQRTMKTNERLALNVISYKCENETMCVCVCERKCGHDKVV